MADALGQDRMEVRAERRVRVTGGEERLRHVADGRGRVVEDGRPLLDLLVEVLREERGVAVRGGQSAPSVPKGTSERTHAVPCQTCIRG